MTAGARPRRAFMKVAGSEGGWAYRYTAILVGQAATSQ